jgi:hypothetical protein
VVRIGARISGVSAPLIAAVAIFAGPGCGSEEFCAEGSYECATAGSSGTGGGSSGTAGQASGGSSAEAGSAGSGGSNTAGSGGGDSGSGSGGFAGMAEGGSSGFGDSGAGGGESGFTGTGGTSGNPIPCTVGDFTEGCTLESNAGLFVSPAGHDDNDGSADAPLATLSAAITKARSGSRVLPIFVCTATYREHPEIHNDGYALHGGFACPDDVDDTWVYDSAERAKIAPSTQGYALRVRDLEGLLVSDLEFTAADGEEPGESSIAVFLSNAVNVRFERVRIVAGDGKDGAPGVLEPFEYREQAQLVGNSSTNATGGAIKDDCACQGSGTTTGGQGGLGGAGPQSGSPGTPVALDGGLAGDVLLACSSGGSGGDGKDGNDLQATELGDGAKSVGTLNDSGWLPLAGASGPVGVPGQGGGGGAGKPGTGVGGGGGGACGGCGGNGASGGRGGGASIAVLVAQSEVTLLSAHLVSSTAGHGGQGLPGQEGQAGGTRGSGSGDGCDGGKGGKGADGGASGGGAGGLSVGILWTGDTAPDVSDDTTIIPGEAGVGGVGGAPLENDGINGVSEEIRRLNG